MEQLNMEEVKQYNAKLKELKERENRLKIEKDMTQKNLEAACAELSKEIGEVVTPDNAEQIYNKLAAQINETLRSGNEIIARIASEEAEAQAGATMNVQNNIQAQANMVQQMAPQAQQSAPVMPQAPIQQAPVLGAAPMPQVEMPQAPMMNTPVMPQAPVVGAGNGGMVIPPMTPPVAGAQPPMLDMPQLFNN